MNYQRLEPNATAITHGRRIVVDTNYAEAVHNGTGPQHVPTARPNYFPRMKRRGLLLWSESKGANPYAVAHGIEQRGTKPNPFFEEACRVVVERYGGRFRP